MVLPSFDHCDVFPIEFPDQHWLEGQRGVFTDAQLTQLIGSCGVQLNRILKHVYNNNIYLKKKPEAYSIIS